MDTSKKYVEMCYEASELQTKNFFQLIADKDVIVGEYNTLFGGVATQLFKQDQLQQILLEDRLSVFDLIRDFNKFGDFDGKQSESSNKHTCFMNSIEQLWLAFVMKEKYNKIWSGKNWIKQE